eukprot:753106-Hanusia_phi.AAC.4
MEHKCRHTGRQSTTLRGARAKRGRGRSCDWFLDLCAGSASDPESLQYAIEKGKGGDMAAAETCLLAYIQERPEDVQALCLLSEVYARTQNFEKSSAVAEQALMVDPDSTESLFLKAR